MKKNLVLLLLLAAVSMIASAQVADNITRKELSQAEIDRIIKKVTENEGDFRVALRSYAFKRYATVNEIGLGGQIAGTYRRDSYMTFNSEGVRFEKILFAPIATTPPGMVTPEDLEDLGGVNPFALEPSMVSQYKFSYVGMQKIDELNLYVFDVAPKVMPDASKTKQRYFMGRIWVDVDDLMIVKSRGKGLPETKKNKFPIVETTREQIDGKYWFPSDARADDELVFDDGAVLRIRMRVRYTEYSVGRSEVRILDDDPTPTPTPTPKPTAKKPE
ncbi:MAG TPA: hypothetical protein PLP21_07235 [Pyrinomonadaceae bacterium]|nr:hypothetical protein [Acidobacteriota bacterium]HQZ96097.1 hypothetical protein [Pyrinomonadaceae bacterium]